ncbi:hypothetical protein K525DRAFT_275448 [Schizophyllum commune Loenen D]|nr:hypothetical protein K525DRAFT_275448 [Schizophyllum commune Loenen D]
MLRRSEEVLGRSQANLLGRTTGREADALAHLSAQVGELRGAVERQTRLLERLLGEKDRRKGKGRAEG